MVKSANNMMSSFVAKNSTQVTVLPRNQSTTYIQSLHEPKQQLD